MGRRRRGRAGRRLLVLVRMLPHTKSHSPPSQSDALLLFLYRSPCGGWAGGALIVILTGWHLAAPDIKVVSLLTCDPSLLALLVDPQVATSK